jgi:hypothetical protein
MMHKENTDFDILRSSLSDDQRTLPPSVSVIYVRFPYIYAADDVVLYKHGQRSTDALKANGFSNVLFKSYNRFCISPIQLCFSEAANFIFFYSHVDCSPTCSLGHYTVPEEMDEVCKWLTANLGLGTSSS